MNKICVLCEPQNFKIETAINKFQQKYKNNQPNKGIACQQHKKMMEYIKDFGIEILNVSPQKDMPYQVFVRDILISEISPVVICNPLKELRRREVKEIKNTLTLQGVSFLEMTEFPLEGGDVIVYDSDMFIGIGDRTNQKGAEWLSSRFQDKCKTHIIETEPNFLHLDMVFNVLTRDCCVIYPGGIAQKSIFFIKSHFQNVIELSENEYENMSCNFLLISNCDLICSSTCSAKVISAASSYNINVKKIDFSEIQKAGGGIRCATSFLQ